MRKTITDRFKITGRGKALHRPMGQGHFLAKKRQSQINRKKGTRGLYLGRTVKRYLEI